MNGQELEVSTFQFVFGNCRHCVLPFLGIGKKKPLYRQKKIISFVFKTTLNSEEKCESQKQVTSSHFKRPEAKYHLEIEIN